VLQQLDDEILLIQQYVYIKLLKLNQLLDGLDVGILASKVQWGRQLLNMPHLVLLILFVVFELVHTNVGCLD